VALLTPLILLAGLIAMVGAPAVLLSRRVGIRIAARRRPALAPLVRLETSHAESGPGLVSGRAA
jgi:hypothetical protein